MTNDTPVLLALGMFAFFSAAGDIMKATTSSTVRRLGSMFKFGAPLSAGYLAVQGAQKTNPFSLSLTFTSWHTAWNTAWNSMKIASPYLGIMAFFVVFLLVLEHAGYINLDAGEVGAAKPPEDGAAD